MDYLNAIIFGVIQGITEFLPVSSSGHLVVLHKLILLPVKNELAFDVVLHSATLLAVVWFFRADIVKLGIGFIRSFKIFSKKDSGHSAGADSLYGKLSWFLILATVPAALAGIFLEDLIESVLRSPAVVAVMLIAVGALFIVFEKISRKTDKLADLNWKKALIIGLAQAVALIPGTSRSGITIIAGLGAGLKREAAIRFSFLLSIPIIFGASIMKIPLMFNAGGGDVSAAGSEMPILAVAFIASFITGLLAIKYFLRFARSHSLNVFAYYRFALAALIIITLI